VDAIERVRFPLEIAAGREACEGDYSFSFEDIQSSRVNCLGPVLARSQGMGALRLAFDYPENSAPLVSERVFRDFARKLIRSIPAPFYSLSLNTDALKLLFLCTLENLDVRWEAGNSSASAAADPSEYSRLFSEETSRLRAVLAANHSMGEFQARIEAIKSYFAKPPE